MKAESEQEEKSKRGRTRGEKEGRFLPSCQGSEERHLTVSGAAACLPPRQQQAGAAKFSMNPALKIVYPDGAPGASAEMRRPCPEKRTIYSGCQRQGQAHLYRCPLAGRGGNVQFGAYQSGALTNPQQSQAAALMLMLLGRVEGLAVVADPQP